MSVQARKRHYRGLCPFCGSDDLEPPKIGALYVECRNCGAFGPSPKPPRGVMRQIEVQIAEAWDLWHTRSRNAAKMVVYTK